jgi:hypothetical protein
VLGQLWRLTTPVPAAGRDALALTIYEHPDGFLHAEESGFEGVACVDDTARLVTVLADVWEATQLPWVRRWALGLWEFVRWMQEPDGRWLNFIHDWEGDKNRAGITSRPGDNFWMARAVIAAQRTATVFEGAGSKDAFERGFACIAEAEAPPDVRVLHMVAALAQGDFLHLERWAQELLACRDGVILKNAAEEIGMPHLWAHIQEGTLAWTARVLDRPAYLDAAIASAEAVIVPAVESAFRDQRSTSPYDVASCIWSLDQLSVTGEERWAALATDARAWFEGRNAAQQPVYDHERGRVGDGIDDDRVSENSGAESNIVAAEVLMHEAETSALAMRDPFAP